MMMFGGSFMPSYGNDLSPSEMWDVVNYVRHGLVADGVKPNSVASNTPPERPDEYFLRQLVGAHRGFSGGAASRLGGVTLAALLHLVNAKWRFEIRYLSVCFFALFPWRFACC